MHDRAPVLMAVLLRMQGATQGPITSKVVTSPRTTAKYTRFRWLNAIIPGAGSVIDACTRVTAIAHDAGILILTAFAAVRAYAHVLGPLQHNTQHAHSPAPDSAYENATTAPGMPADTDICAAAASASATVTAVLRQVCNSLIPAPTFFPVTTPVALVAHQTGQELPVLPSSIAPDPATGPSMPHQGPLRSRDPNITGYLAQVCTRPVPQHAADLQNLACQAGEQAKKQPSAQLALLTYLPPPLP